MRKIIFTPTILALAIAAGSAHAVTTSTAPEIIDFNITSLNGGSIVWDAATDRLIGSNIQIASVTSQTLPDLTTVTPPVECTGCVLNFTTGTHTGGGDFSGSLDGSSITITTPDTVLGTTGTLMSGKFTGGAVIDASRKLHILGGGFDDTKPTSFTTGLGFSPDMNQWAGAINLQFASNPKFEKGQTLSPLSGDVSNAAPAEPSAVPLPPAAWLFGSGVTAIGAIARRKRDIPRV